MLENKLGIIQNSVQYKNDIFKPFREKQKKQLDEGKKILPAISEFEIGLLNEYVQTRFGLTKKLTAYDMLIAKAGQKRQEAQKLEEEEKKRLNDGIRNKSLPNLSFMNKQNPYLLDFKKSMVNHGREIIDTIAKNPKFRRRSELEDSRIFSTFHNSSINSQIPEIDTHKRMAPSSSLASLDLEK